MGQAHPRVIIHINFADLKFPMLHAKFQDHWTSGLGQEYFLRFHHIWAWLPSFSCDLDYLIKLTFPPFKEALHVFRFLLAKHFLRCFDIVDDDNDDDDAGAWVYYKITL